MQNFVRLCLGASLALMVVSCAGPAVDESQPVLRYVGSSTIAHFIVDAQPAYGSVRFELDTEPESAGGEAAILEGRADVAGVANRPRSETLDAGVRSTLIGRDAIAVVVNAGNPIEGLSQEELRRVFTGQVLNWNELGGQDLAVRPFIVGPESATRRVFRAAILREADYAGCEVVRPDADIAARVRAEPGGIGQISFSFLGSSGEVKAISVGGQRPVPTNSDYPIARPLYLLWWPGRGHVEDFIRWTSSPAARSILLQRFASPGGDGDEGERR